MHTMLFPTVVELQSEKNRTQALSVPLGCGEERGKRERAEREEERDREHLRNPEADGFAKDEHKSTHNDAQTHTEGGSYAQTGIQTH